MTLDLAIRGGTVVTAADTMRCDVGIRGETVAMRGARQGRGPGEPVTLDASPACWCCRAASTATSISPSSSGEGTTVMADDFRSGHPVSAAFGREYDRDALRAPAARASSLRAGRARTMTRKAAGRGCYIDVIRST